MANDADSYSPRHPARLSSPPSSPETLGKLFGNTRVFVMGSRRYTMSGLSAFLPEVSEFCATPAEEASRQVRTTMIEITEGPDRRTLVPSCCIAIYSPRLRSPHETTAIEYGRPHCTYFQRPHPDSHHRRCPTTNLTELFKPTPSNIL